ncbi:hypothetical protein [Kitasatospora paranensis]
MEDRHPAIRGCPLGRRHQGRPHPWPRCPSSPTVWISAARRGTRI